MQNDNEGFFSRYFLFYTVNLSVKGLLKTKPNFELYIFVGRYWNRGKTAGKTLSGLPKVAAAAKERFYLQYIVLYWE